MIGTGFESKTQLGLMVILAASLVNFVIGTFIPITKEQNLRGITGYSCMLRKLLKFITLIAITMFRDHADDEFIARMAGGDLLLRLRRLLPCGDGHHGWREHLRRFERPADSHSKRDADFHSGHNNHLSGNRLDDRYDGGA